MELALLADIRVAGRAARFGELFVKRGLCSDVAGIGRLAQLVGRERAAELLFTGEVVGAERAERIGLVSRVVDDERVLSSALEVAHRIAANPPLAVAAPKRGLRKALDPDWTALGGWVSETLGELFDTEDHREGVRSFIEKREPRYVGRQDALSPANWRTGPQQRIECAEVADNCRLSKFAKRRTDAQEIDAHRQARVQPRWHISSALSTTATTRKPLPSL